MCSLNFPNSMRCTCRYVYIIITLIIIFILILHMKELRHSDMVTQLLRQWSPVSLGPASTFWTMTPNCSAHPAWMPLQVAILYVLYLYNHFGCSVWHGFHDYSCYSLEMPPLSFQKLFVLIYKYNNGVKRVTGRVFIFIFYIKLGISTLSSDNLLPNYFEF